MLGLGAEDWGEHECAGLQEKDVTAYAIELLMDPKGIKAAKRELSS